MSQEIEIEKTFLAAYLPKEIEEVEPDVVEDTYIPESDDFAVLRLRRRGNNHEIMKKSPVVSGDFSEHVEDSIKLEEKEYKALRDSSNKRVSKNRYKVKIDGYDAEVDVFVDDMAGLVLVDFEFNSREEYDKFIIPDCCLVEVTQELTIRGGQLAGGKYEDIEKWLSQKGFKKIV